jgi:hypothetical protein
VSLEESAELDALSQGQMKWRGNDEIPRPPESDIQRYMELHYKNDRARLSYLAERRARMLDPQSTEKTA